MTNQIEQRAFLSELAAKTNSTVESLIEAGYDESVPVYLANGLSVRQVANVILSSRRRAAAQRDAVR